MSDPRADQLRAGYASVARGYREQLADELAGKPLDRAFLAAFAERCTGPIVEVGCGPGQVARFLAGCGARIEGTDLSPAMIDEARALCPELSFRVADMFALPYAEASLSGIVAFYAIVHLRTSELLAPVRDWHRVLVPGGLVAIAFHAGDEVVHVDELFGATTNLDFVSPGRRDRNVDRRRLHHRGAARPRAVSRRRAPKSTDVPTRAHLA